MLKVIPIWVWVLLAGALAVGFQELRISWKESALVTAQSERDTAQAKAESLATTLGLSRDLLKDRDLVDAKYSKDLANAQADNAQLRSDIAAGRKRVSVNATCVRDATSSGAAGSADAGTPRLTPDAEQARADLELAVEQQRLQIVGLQEYTTGLLARLRAQQ